MSRDPKEDGAAARVAADGDAGPPTAKDASMGVLGKEYADQRTSKPALVYRYRARARLAYEALERYRSLKGWYSVLELGAAEGRTLLELRRLIGPRGEFDGVELSQELIDAAPSLPEDTRLLHGDITALPAEVSDNHYDLVCALAVLEHVPEPAVVLRAALSKLKSGGLFVATVPNPVWDQVASRLGLVDGDAHEVSLGLADLRRLARDAGFSQVETFPFMFVGVAAPTYLGFTPKSQTALGIDRVLRAVLPRLAFVNQALVAIKG